MWWVAAGVLVVAGLAALGGLATSPGAAVAAVPRSAATAVAAGFDADLLAEVAAYRAPRRRVQLVLLLMSAVMPPVVAALILRRWTPASPRLPMVAAVTAAGLVLATSLARLPLVAWTRVIHDGRYGFRTGSVVGWALDHAGAVLARAMLAAVVAALVVRLVQRDTASWPARVTVLVAAIGATGLLLHPLVVHPLLLPTGPVPPGEHRDAIMAVIDRSGLDVPVLMGEASLRTTRRNAVVTGLGPTRRIVLHDTMFELPPDEVAAITAHELAHVERSDPLRGVLAPLPLLLAAGLGLRRWSRRSVGLTANTVVVAVAAVLALEAATAPLVAAASRVAERAADARAVELTGDTEAYEMMLRAFVTDGLADPDPPRWSVVLLGTHPPIGARIAVVRAVADAASGTSLSDASTPDRPIATH